MITEAHGNLLDADVDALVNTVNTVGVMGKGIALQFRRAYPEMFADYEHAVRAGDVSLGKMHVWPTGALTGPRYVINFPTKGHWRAKSKLSDIDAGLRDLVHVVIELGIALLRFHHWGAATVASTGDRSSRGSRQPQSCSILRSWSCCTHPGVHRPRRRCGRLARLLP